MNSITQSISKRYIAHLFLSKLKWSSAVCIGIMAAAIFASISSYRLTYQGVYYDELHQAAGSFSYVGSSQYREAPPYMFVRASIHGIPLLNMSYSGAIKTAIYGLYLRLFGTHFSVFDWRLIGIIFVSFGVLLFFVVTAGRLSLFSLSLFFFLFLTDTTVLLMTRHDWGPVALAILLRLLFIAIWINGETSKAISPSNSFILGCLVGIATFEKLSSLVLVFVLILVLVSSPLRRSVKHWSASLLGGILGGAPLIILNVYSLLVNGHLVSLEAVPTKPPYSLSALTTYLSQYIDLGAGGVVKRFVLGVNSSGFIHADGILLSSVLLLIAILYFQHHKSSLFFRLSGIMLLSYITLGISIYLLPKRTWINHWIIGTPFQYAAILLAVQAAFCKNIRLTFQNWIPRVVLVFIISILVVARLLGSIEVARALDRGQASIYWDPSLSKIGHFASSRSHEAVFIAADWGLATQLFCLSNGNPYLVHEPFWDYKGPDQLRQIVEDSGKKICYVACINPRKGIRPHNTVRILHDIKRLPVLKQLPVEAEIAELGAVEVEKYSYIGKNSR